MLKGKNALVTGGARGNGEGIAVGLLRAGAKVYVIDVDCGIEKNIEYIQIDLTDKDGVKVILDELFNEGIVFDILVNCAGISISDASEKYDLENWYKTLEINLTTPFFLSQLVATAMIKQEKKGSIINITSLGAEYGFPENPAYCASKGGLKQLTKALAYDWAKYGIRVNNVGPGYMRTRMTEKSYADAELREDRSRHMMLPRWGNPEDLVGVCVFLASRYSEYITGQDIYVDGGWTAKGL